jgi:uncharacterized protein (TIGR00255 family)
MIQSMTGYGRGTAAYNDMKVLSEIRSLNSKVTDLRIKMPVNLGEKELELRNLVLQRTQRGKIEMTVSFEGDLALDDIDYDRALIRKHFNQLSDIASSLGVGPEQILHEVLKLPNILRTVNNPEIDNKLWTAILDAVNESIDQLIQFRTHEGKSQFHDLLQSATAIYDMCNSIEAHDKERLAFVRTRMKQKLDEYLNGEHVDANRFEQELIYFLDRLDINEEKVRLQQHCTFFLQTLSGDMEMKSKQLNFIAQELGREINTLGAKAQWSPLQHLVVGMKNELEKIKEQLANIV